MISLHIAIPLLQHAALSAALGKAHVLRMESLPPSASFKPRCIAVDLDKLESWTNQFK